jgi:protein ImuB
VWCPDWPVTAAGHGRDEAVAVLASGRVVACSEAARAEGIAPGLRRRQAESRCSGLVVVDDDPARDARAFEPVVASVEEAAPAVEILQPGLCALPSRGPARYYGSEAAAVTWVTQAVERTTGPGGCRVGIAEGSWAASQAARRGAIVPPDPGETERFLATLPVDVLDDPDLTDHFRRLGLRLLGDVAALPAASMLERFGPPGARAHRLASGRDERPHLPRVPPEDLAVSMGFDPPADRLDTVLFAARQLAAELAVRLEERVLGCTVLAIEAETAAGRTLVRRWRHEDGLTPQALSERVRWQVEAWLLRGGEDGDGVPGGLARLRLIPELVHPERGRQLGFWGASAADELVAGALVRMQGMLGAEAVATATLVGGRTPSARIRLTPWGATPPQAEADPPRGTRAATGRSPGRLARDPERPAWPGRIPPPSPATVYAEPPGVALLDGGGAPVTVDERGHPSAEPAALRMPGAPPAEVGAWAGPWPADERWWDPAGRCRRTRMQVLTLGGDAHLLAFDGDRWLLEATYD